MGKVELPFVEPMYSTYLWLSDAGIPAKQNPTSDNWYFNNTVQWRCTKKFLEGYTTPKIHIGVGGIWDIDFLYKSGINTRFIKGCLISMIKNMLNEGYYVSLSGVDDFYVKGKSWYQERHFNHTGLIVGYDDDDESFTMAAYDERWIFTVFKTPQKCIVEGVEALRSQGVYGGVVAVQAKEDSVKLDVDLIKTMLGKYLSSTVANYKLHSDDMVWGLAVYDYICIYLDKLIDGSIPHEKRDRRIFRFIWEHKKCMLQRMRAVEKECEFNNDLSDEYENIVTLADQARFIYSKFVIKFSFSNLEKIQAILMQMKSYEKRILSDFLDRLKKKLPENCNVNG